MAIKASCGAVHDALQLGSLGLAGEVVENPSARLG